MKINKLPFLVLALCFLFACGGEEETPAPANDLSGSWKVTDISYEGTSVSSYGGYTFSSNFTGTGFDHNLVINFDDSPNTYTSSGDYSIKMTFQADGQTYTQNWTNQGFIDGGNWSRAGNELTITSNSSGAQKATILELTSTILKLGYNSTQTAEQDGMTVTSTITGSYTFQRQ